MLINITWGTIWSIIIPVIIIILVIIQTSYQVGIAMYITKFTVPSNCCALIKLQWISVWYRLRLPKSKGIH